MNISCFTKAAWFLFMSFKSKMFSGHKKKKRRRLLKEGRLPPPTYVYRPIRLCVAETNIDSSRHDTTLGCLFFFPDSYLMPNAITSLQHPV